MTILTKCDFCSNSINKNGKLVCKWGKDGCSMPQKQIMEILKLIVATNNKGDKNETLDR